MCLGVFCLLVAVSFAMNLNFRHKQSTGHILAGVFVDGGGHVWGAANELFG